MSCPVARKANKVFLKMSREVKTRSADQCRSHHQKILKYHNSIEDIIAAYRTRSGSSEKENKEADRRGTGLDLFPE